MIRFVSRFVKFIPVLGLMFLNITTTVAYPIRSCFFDNIYMFGDLHTNTDQEAKASFALQQALEKIPSNQKMVILAESFSQPEIEFRKISEALEVKSRTLSALISSTPESLKNIKSSRLQKEIDFFKRGLPDWQEETKKISTRPEFLTLFAQDHQPEWIKRFCIINIDQFRRPFILMYQLLNLLSMLCIMNLYDASLAQPSIDALVAISPSFDDLKTSVQAYKTMLKQLDGHLPVIPPAETSKQTPTKASETTGDEADTTFSFLTQKLRTLIAKLSTSDNKSATPLSITRQPIVKLLWTHYQTGLHQLVKKNDATFLEMVLDVINEGFWLFHMVVMPCKTSTALEQNVFCKSLEYVALNTILDPIYANQAFLIFSGFLHTFGLRKLFLTLKKPLFLDRNIMVNTQATILSDDWYLAAMFSDSDFNAKMAAAQNTGTYFKNHFDDFQLILKTTAEMQAIESKPA